MQYSQSKHHEQGVVSLLTVLMFSILIGILLTGFTRIVIQEQQDTLQDDLSKSAYNSAQAGIEDAKRAIQYCANTYTITDGEDCRNLYNTKCPGFNSKPVGATKGAFEDIGIPQPTASGSAIGDPGVRQRYTCVLVSPSTDIVTTLGASNTTNNTTLYKLEGLGGAAFDTVELSWHGPSEGAPTLPTQTTVQNLNKGNRRQPDWTYPALLRATFIASDATLSTVQQQQLFLYPTSDSSTTGATFASPSSVFVKCSLITTYSCTLPVDMTGTQANRFIVLQPFYKGTTVSIKLRNGGAAGSVVAVNGEQTTIDATGSANDVFRRVQARVASGKPVATSSALDVGNSICKNFFVSADTFDNPDCN